MREYIGALDQGTTSTRFIIFDRGGKIIACAQQEHEQIYPRPGWVEHDAEEIWRRTQSVISGAMKEALLQARDLAAVGITNQRETTVVWNKKTGRPIHNAIVWQDTRVSRDVAAFSAEGGQDRYREETGLPLATYFSALKIRWILENVSGARDQADAGDLLCGTVDSFIAWHLTGGVGGGIHVTEVTNASRTQLMDLRSLQWDAGIARDFDIPIALLPKIVSSSDVYGHATIDGIKDVPIAGMLGDQQAALVGQCCFRRGEAKNTYGTGCFLLMNTGEKQVPSNCGLITTVAYRFGRQPACYALEGSIAITGALVQWLRDNLGLIRSSSEIELLARSVEDNGGAYFVPAFSGLYAPYWKDSARGVIAGLTRFVNRGHIARAVLEATAFQVREVVEAMVKDADTQLDSLRVDGGMVTNELLMQFQSDMLAIPVVCPREKETTAMGAAYAAGLAVGYWSGTEELASNWVPDRRWEPTMKEEERERLYRWWKKAVTRAFDWTE